MNTPQATAKPIRLGIGVKILFATMLVLVLLLAFTAYINFENTRQRVEKEEYTHLQTLADSYNNLVATESVTAETLAISIADRADVSRLFKNQDRAGLLALLGPLFATLRDNYNVVHLYVEDANGKVFVRVHNPERFGDDVTYRLTAATSLKNQQPVAGIEIGPNRLGIRGVAPLFDGEKFIGMVEVGIDYDQALIDKLKQKSGADYTMWVSHEAARPAGLQPQANAPVAPNEELFFYASSLLSPLPVPAELYHEALTTGKDQVTYIQENGIFWTVLISPLLGYQGRIIGIFEIATPRTAILDEIRAERDFTLVMGAIVSLAGIVFIWLATQFFLRPFGILITASKAYMGGRFAEPVTITTGDEFETLGDTFNALSERLNHTIDELEERVAERTRALEASVQEVNQRANQLEIIASVTETIASIKDSSQLLPTIANLVSERFNFYHTGIFLLSSDEQYAILQAANSLGGKTMLARGHKLRVGSEGMVGFVIAENRGRIALDVGHDAIFFNNPDLPTTRSEITLPLRLGEKVIGALDVQSEQESAFSEEDVSVLTTLANQIAVAIENARLFEQTRQTAQELERQFAETSKANWQAFTAESRQTGFRATNTTVEPIRDGAAFDQLSPIRLEVPIRLRGVTIGTLGVVPPEHGQEFTEYQIAIIQAAAERMALAMEAARLFSATRKRAERERTIADISSKISSSVEVDEILRSTAAELRQVLGAAEVLLELDTENRA